MRRRDFLFLSAAALAAGMLPPAALAARSTTVSYGSGKLDIYPAASAAAPVVAYVHGGAWRAGSRGEVGSMPEHFNALGYVFVSIGYTLRGSP